MISNKWVKTAALLLMLVMAASFWIYKQNSLFHPHNLQCLHTKSEWLRIENSFLLLVILFHISSSQVAKKTGDLCLFQMFWPHLPPPSFPQPPTPLTNPWNFPEWKKCSTNDVSGVGAGALNGRRAIKEPLISSSVNCYQLLSWLPPTRFLEHYCRHQDHHGTMPPRSPQLAATFPITCQHNSFLALHLCHNCNTKSRY